MHTVKRLCIPLLLPLLLLIPASGVYARIVARAPAALVKVAHNVNLGAILVDAKGRTLYYLQTEKHGAIKCTGSCETYWPPFYAPHGVKTLVVGHAVPGKLATVRRPDGEMQLTYNKWPLYYFKGDSKPGQTNGQGVAKVWWVISVKAAAPSSGGSGGGGW